MTISARFKPVAYPAGRLTFTSGISRNAAPSPGGPAVVRERTIRQRDLRPASCNEIDPIACDRVVPIFQTLGKTQTIRRIDRVL